MEGGRRIRLATTCALALGAQLALAAGAQATSFPATPGTLGQIPPEEDEQLEVEFPVSDLAADVPSEVSVTLTMDHTWAGDLTADLVAPDGTRTALFAIPAENNESSDFGGTYRFSDRAPATPTLPDALGELDNGQVLPSESYRATDGDGNNKAISSAFSGVTDPNGTWTVEVTDTFPAQDNGSATAASLELVGAVSARPDSLGAIPNGTGPGVPGVHRDIIFDVSGLPLGAPADVAVSLTATHPWAGEFDVVLVDPELTPATVFSRTGATIPTAPGSHSNLNGTYRFYDGAPAAPSWWTAAQNAAGGDIPSGSYRSSSPGGDAGGGATTSLTPAFAGLEDPNGTWALQVRDFFSSVDTGEVTAAALTVLGGDDTAAPTAPDLLQAVPDSPSSSNAPKLRGGAETGAMVRLYANGDCSGLASVVGTAGDFSGAGITVNVGSDATHLISATQYDTSGNVSGCTTTPLTYVEDSTKPATPTLTTTDPPSPADDDTPKLHGTAEDASTITIYESLNCSGTPFDTGTAGLFTGFPGIELSVDEDEEHPLSVTATDEARNVSDCSEPYVYREDSTVPETTATTPKPKVKTKKRKATVRFNLGADEVDIEFECSIDDAPFTPCQTPIRPELRRGKHTVEAVATDAAGHEDPTPAEAKVRIVRKR